jgi:hypothetical protein
MRSDLTGANGVGQSRSGGSVSSDLEYILKLDLV